MSDSCEFSMRMKRRNAVVEANLHERHWQRRTSQSKYYENLSTSVNCEFEQNKITKHPNSYLSLDSFNQNPLFGYITSRQCLESRS